MSVLLIRKESTFDLLAKSYSMKLLIAFTRNMKKFRNYNSNILPNLFIEDPPIPRSLAMLLLCVEVVYVLVYFCLRFFCFPQKLR